MKLADAKGDLALEIELTNRWLHHVKTDPGAIAYSPNPLGRIEELGFNDLRLLKVPKSQWPFFGVHDVGAMEARLERARGLAEIRPYLRAFMERIRSRRLAFWRFYEMNDLSRKELPSHACLKCGSEVYKRPGRGRYSKFCSKPECDGASLYDHQTSQRQERRRFQRRTRET